MSSDADDSRPVRKSSRLPAILGYLVVLFASLGGVVASGLLLGTEAWLVSGADDVSARIQRIQTRGRESIRQRPSGPIQRRLEGEIFQAACLSLPWRDYRSTEIGRVVRTGLIVRLAAAFSLFIAAVGLLAKWAAARQLLRLAVIAVMLSVVVEAIAVARHGEAFVSAFRRDFTRTHYEVSERVGRTITRDLPGRQGIGEASNSEFRVGAFIWLGFHALLGLVLCAGRGPLPRASATMLMLSLAFIASGCTSAPDDAEITGAERRGMAALAAGKNKEAAVIFRDEVRTTRSGLSYLGLARAHAELGDQARFEAIAMQASIELPRTPLTWHRLGALYVKGAERFRDAPSGPIYARMGVDYLRRVFVVQPANPELLHSLGVGLILMDDDPAAMTVLEEVVRLEPGRIASAHLLLHVYHRLERPKSAIALIRNYSKKGPVPEDWSRVAAWAEGSIEKD